MKFLKNPFFIILMFFLVFTIGISLGRHSILSKIDDTNLKAFFMRQPCIDQDTWYNLPGCLIYDYFGVYWGWYFPRF